jgi:hypothetical protein
MSTCRVHTVLTNLIRVIAAVAATFSGSRRLLCLHDKRTVIAARDPSHASAIIWTSRSGAGLRPADREPWNLAPGGPYSALEPDEVYGV